MAELIGRNDDLNTGREKLNEGIKASERSERKSDEAVNIATTKGDEAISIANRAENKSDNTQMQLDTIVIEGDSSVEAAQARVKADGKTFETLQDRLNSNDLIVEKKANQTFPTSTVFRQNVDFNSRSFRIPFMCTTKHGTLIAGSDIRYNGSSDWDRIEVGIARSEDGGATWKDKQVIIENNNVSSIYSRAMDGTIIYDEQEDKIYVFAVKLDDEVSWYRKNNKSNWDVVYVMSNDDGKTWSDEISISYVTDGFANREVFLGGVGSGIVMENGTIVLPAQTVDINDPTTSSARIRSCIIYSDDKGTTWKMSESILPETSSECNVVEYEPGKLLLNARQDLPNQKRVLYKTDDMGLTWEPLESNYYLSKNKLYQSRWCMGSTIKATLASGKEKILYSAPYNTETENGPLSRYNPTLFYSENNGESWEVVASIYPGKTQGYSCLSYHNDKLFVVLEIEGDIVVRNISKLLDKVEEDKKIDEFTPSVHTFYISNEGDDNNLGYLPESPLKTINKAFRLANFSKGDVINIYILDDLTDINNVYIENSTEAEQINIISENAIRPLYTTRIRNTTSVIYFKNIKFIGRIGASNGLVFYNNKLVRFDNCEFHSDSIRVLLVDYSKLILNNPRFFNQSGMSEVLIRSVNSEVIIDGIEVEDNISTGIDSDSSIIILSNKSDRINGYSSSSTLLSNTNIPIKQSGRDIIENNFVLRVNNFFNGWTSNTTYPLYARINASRLTLTGAANIGPESLTNGTIVAKIPKYEPKFEQHGIAIGNVSSTQKVVVLIRFDVTGNIRLGQNLEGLGIQSLQLDGISIEI